MARRVFFSFHYQRDIWRINQIRNLPNVAGCAAAGFIDASLWEESKRQGDAAIKRMIDDGLSGTSVTIVFIGSQTAGRKFIDYEIEKSITRGNAVIGIQIHHLKDRHGNPDPVGITPTLLTKNGFNIYKYSNMNDLAKVIEDAARAAGK